MKKKIRLDNIFTYITLFLPVPFVIMLILLQVYSIHQDISGARKEYRTAAENISQSLQLASKGIFQSLRDATYSNEFIYVCNSSNVDTVNTNARRLLNSCESGFFARPEVMAVLLINSRCDYILRSSRSFEMLPLNQEIENTVLDFPDATDFFCSVKEIGGVLYYFYSIADRYGMITVMVDPAKSTVFQDYASIYNDSVHFSFSVCPPADTDTSVSSLKMDSINLYLLYTYDLFRTISAPQLAFLAVIFLLLLSIPLVAMILYRLISRPLRLISNGMRTITEGDFDYRIPEVRSIDDIRTYADGVNLMLDTIQRAKDEEYRSHLDTMQAQLQYLQLQIRPHFYLNCMKNLNSLIDLKEYEKAQTLIYALANYIPHAFMDIRKFITVREELEAVQNYVDLCNSLSYDIRLGFKLDGRSPGMNCLPMSLLTFVENSIKHTKTGIDLAVFITVEILSDPDGISLIKYTIRDSGGGFPETILQEQHSIDPSKPVYHRSHIGIDNVRYRLFLVFGSEASLTLRNEGCDAVVEIVTPSDADHRKGAL